MPDDRCRAVKHGEPVMIDESTLSSWGKALAIVAAFGVVGAFIDFYIGKSGQRRVRDWLETWWLRLSYVRWGNIGREEALFAVQVMDRLFGRQLFSVKRIIVVILLIISVFVTLIMPMIIFGDNPVKTYVRDFGAFKVCGSSSFAFHISEILIRSMVSLALSFSFTRIASVIVAKILTRVPLFNLVGILLLFIFQYLVFCYWGSFATQNASYSFTFCTMFNFRNDYETQLGFIIMFGSLYYPISFMKFIFHSGIHYNDSYVFELYLSIFINLIPNLIRFSIMAIFIFSFLLKPVQQPIMTLWARVIESDRPVFTLLFGGAAALAKAIQEIVKIF
jgi:hypothetical protein